MQDDLIIIDVRSEDKSANPYALGAKREVRQGSEEALDTREDKSKGGRLVCRVVLGSTIKIGDLVFTIVSAGTRAMRLEVQKGVDMIVDSRR